MPREHVERLGLGVKAMPPACGNAPEHPRLEVERTVGRAALALAAQDGADAFRRMRVFGLVNPGRQMQQVETRLALRGRTDQQRIATPVDVGQAARRFHWSPELRQ